MEVPFAEDLTISDDTLCVDLGDGRSISVPLAISPDALASSYQIGDRRLLDHSPEVLGLESGTNEHQREL
ncbi:MAG: hypothetical protein ACTS6J_13530 [Burkholderiales bacterium]